MKGGGVGQRPQREFKVLPQSRNLGSLQTILELESQLQRGKESDSTKGRTFLSGTEIEYAFSGLAVIETLR